MNITNKKITDLKEYATNPRKHSEEQIKQIANSIKTFGFNVPILIDNYNEIIAGHGRLYAARILELKEVPTICLKHLTEAQKKAFVIADNKIALNGEWDDELLVSELAYLNDLDLDLGFDLMNYDLLGFDKLEVTELIETVEGVEDEKYTKKIDAPVYTPSGEEPSIEEMYDNTREQKLVKEIEKSKIPNDIKDFLKVCAQRHTVFDYGKIAEYYCHANKATQKLMEKSALIVIDFDQAIKEGYVVLSEEVKQQYLEDYND